MSSVQESRTEDSLWGWQSQTATVAQRAKHALSTEAFADITFQFPSDDGSFTNIKAHKCVLAMGSAVFETMFFGNIPETRDTIPITDIDVEIFRIILRYIYHDQIGPFDTNTAFPTLYAAKKYGMSILKNAALDYLKTGITVENCVYWLVQAQQYAEEEMQTLCMELVDVEGSTVLESENFLQLDLAVLKLILIRDTLNATEMEVYAAAIKWAVNQCMEKGIEDCGTNYRLVLHDALGLIRFPLMTLEESAPAAESGMLSANEVNELFLWFAKNKPPTTFTTKERRILTGPINGPVVSKVTVSRFQKPYRFGNSSLNHGLWASCRDVVKFCVVSVEYTKGIKAVRKDVLVNLVGFDWIVRDQFPCFGSPHSSTVATIHKTLDGAELLDESWDSDGDWKDNDIRKCMFGRPIPLLLNTEYQLSVEATGIFSSAFVTTQRLTSGLAVHSAGSYTLNVSFANIDRPAHRNAGQLEMIILDPNVTTIALRLTAWSWKA